MDYTGYSEKEITMKGLKMFKNTRQKDNAMLLLEWETKFYGLVVAAELNCNKKNLK
jgi:hypothetical protein